MAVNTRLPKVTQYIKNVGKSVAFASIEVIKENSSGISDFLEANSDIMKEGYASIKNYRAIMRSIDRSIRQNKVFTAVQAGMKNMMEDVKSGNYWNEERLKATAESALGLDDDFDFEDDDYSFSSSDDSPEPSVDAKSITNSFDAAIGAAANAQTTAVAQGTNLVIQSNIASTKMIINQFQSTTAALNSGLGAVYTAIDRTNKFLYGPMQTHLENSKIYFENSTKLMQDQSAMMKEILEMQRNLYKKQQDQDNRARLTDSIDYSGAVNLTGYGKNIKKNIANLMDNTGLSMLNMDMGMGNPYMVFAAAPLKFVVQPIISQMLSKDFKKALQAFDKSLTTMFSQVVARMNKRNKSNFGGGGLLDIISQIFGVNVDTKDTIDTSKYNKGPVPFDGITRKTINEVIPGYLSRIEAALTGHQERHFDHNSGTFKSASQIEAEFKREKTSAIAQGNSSLQYELRGLIDQIRGQSEKGAKDLEKQLDRMYARIFKDSGVLSRNPGDTGEPAWKYYGFKSEEDFERVMDFLEFSGPADSNGRRKANRNGRAAVRDLAFNNMQARENLSRRMRDAELNGGIYNRLHDGTYDTTGAGKIGKYNGPSGFKGGSGLLALSADKDGKNVFWYLREILNSISGRRGKRGKGGSRGRRPRPTPSGGPSNNNSSGSSDDSSDDPDPAPDDDESIDSEIWDNINEQRRKQEEEEANRHKAGNWLRDTIGNTAVGKAILDGSSAIGRILSKPMEYTVKLLNKADDNLFKMMFGKNEYKDKDGNTIDSVFDYMIYKVKETFKTATDWMKKNIFEPFKEKYWDKYGKPVADQVKGYANKGWNRVKKGFKNTFGRFGEIIGKGGVGDADDITPDDVQESAGGRFVTKRGLTMISPGEMIIPATFNKAEQAKMLAAEKREKQRIFNKIGYNAKGTVDTDALKNMLGKMYEENKGKGAKTAAGGVLGLGAGVITGFNPILGALAGSALSFVSESDTFKDFLFGKERDGNGVIPKKAYDIFKKNGADMFDFGLAGGALGMFTPFGILGGAAMGAGLGYLKNSESFKEFIFGKDTGDGNTDGILNKKNFDAFKAKAKDVAPTMLAGAGLGILAGPFGIIGNAAMGAGLGMLSTTETFKKFMFGEEELDADGNKTGKRNGGVMGAFKNGVIEPAKEKMLEFAVAFKDYAKENILDPMKRFWEPMKDAIKNTIAGVGDRVKDFLNDMFEKTLGIPLNDFLQEKLFKPVSKLIFGLLKAPIKAGKAIVAAPFKALGAVGDSMRMRQIQKGTAYGMSASQRIAFRQQHAGRNFLGTALGRDKMLEQDTLLANMSDDDLQLLQDQAGAQIHSREELQKIRGNANKALGNEISGFFNSNKLYGTVSIKDSEKLSKIGQTGDLRKLQAAINKLNISPEQKTELFNKISSKATAAGDALRASNAARIDQTTRDAALTQILGRKFRGHKDARQLYRSAEAELKARRKGKVESTPESSATDLLSQIVKEKTEKVINILEESNKALKKLAGIEDKDTNPPGDRNDEGKNKAEDSNDVNRKTAARAAYDKALKEASNNRIDPTTGNVISDNEDSKENKENEKEKEEIRRDDRENAEANKQASGILGKIHEKLFGGDKKKEKKEKEGILGKIGNLFGGLSKFMGVGTVAGKIAMGAVGISLFGHATQWFKTAVWPSIKETLFGRTNEDGTQSNGLLGGLKATILGDGQKEGFLQKLLEGIGEKFQNFINWYQGKGGISGIIVNDVLPKLIAGWGYAVDNVVAPLTALLIKSLPGIAIGLVKGVVSGLKMAIFNKELPRESKVDLNTTTVQKEIQDLNKSNSSAFESSMGSLGASLKNAFNTGRASAAYTASNVASIDLSVFGSAKEDSNNERTGMLGATRRTNKVEYDEDGNITTTYTQMNHTDSVLSRGAGSASRAFVNGLAGIGGGSLVTTAANTVKAGSGFGKGILGAVTRGTTAATKAGGGILGAAGKAGEMINTGLTHAAGMSQGLGNATTAAANAGKGGIGQKIATGIANIFSKLAKGKIGGLITKAAKLVSPDTTLEIVVKALEKIGKVLGEKAMSGVAGKALNSIATAIAGFSPLAIALFVTDFLWGYNNANTILGVADGDTEYSVGFGQKCLCGLLHMVNQKITLGFIPTETIVDIIVDYLFPIFKLDATSLKEAQARATEILDEWNKEHPDEQYDNLQDYNNRNKWTTKIWKGVTGAASNAWDTVKSGASAVATGAKNLGTSIVNGTKQLGSNVSNWVSEKFDAAKSMATFVKDVTQEVIKSATDPEYHWDINSYLSEDDPLAGAKKSLYQALKIPLGIIGCVSAVGKKIGDVISGFVNKVKDGGKDAFQSITNVAKGQYTVFNKQYWQFDDKDKDNPMSTLSKVVSTITRVLGMPHAMVGYVGSKVIDIFKKLISGAREGALDSKSDVDAVKAGQYTIFNQQYWKSEIADDGNPISKLGSVFGFVSRIVQAPMAMIGWVGTKVKDTFNKIVQSANEGILDASSDVDAVKTGQYTIFSGDYWHSDTEDTDNPISKLGSVFGFVSRVVQAPMAMIGYVGTKIKEVFNTIRDGASEGILDATEDVNAVKQGQYTIFSSEYWKSNEEDTDNPLSKLGSVFGFVSRVVQAPMAMIGWVGTKVKEGFTNIVNGVKDITETTDKVIEKAEKGDISVFSSEYWKLEDDKGNPLGMLGNVVSFIQRLTQAPIVIFKNVFNKIKEKFDAITGWFKKLFGEDAEEVDTEANTNGSGRGRKGYGRFGRLFGKAHAYQNDPSIAGMRYGDSTIGEAGCAPVAATNLINRMTGYGNGMTVDAAARYAEAHGKTVPGGGTDVSYFNSILGSQGIPSTSTSNRSEVLDALRNGNPVVMLGEDGSNYPGSPFGANPHFVTANGMDANGNIIAEDPDLPNSYNVYDRNTMLNSMTTSVIAGQSRRRRRSGTKRRTGRAYETQTYASTGTSTASNGNNLGPNAIINVAKSQIGINDGGINKCKYNYAYYNRDVSGSDYAWCCAFVWWVFNQAGASHLVKKTAGCTQMANYFKEKGRYFTSNPQPGDLVFFDWKGNKSRYQHIGIVTGMNGNKVCTIEGNTSGTGSQDNGGYVMAKERDMKWITGFARPEYPYNYSAGVDMSKYGDSTNYKSIAINGGQMTGDQYSSMGSFDNTTSFGDMGSSTTSGLLGALTNLGQSMATKLYGADVVGAFFGNNTADATTLSSTGGFVADGSYTPLSATESSKTIWNYLKKKGYTDYGAAGLMGCWQAESSNRADRLEGDYLKSFPGFSAATASSNALDNYTQNVLFPAYARSGISISKKGYQGSDGHYYPGFGLAQWTGPRAYKLLEYAKSQGKDWRALDGQLAYFDTEDTSRGLMAKMNKATSPSDGAYKGLAYYEMSEGYASKHPEAVSKRANYANAIYANYKGTSGDSSTAVGVGRGRGHARGGTATAALNARRRYAGGAGTTVTTAMPANGGAVDYVTFLQTIVSVLVSISDNTALLNKILTILSDNFGVEINKSDIESAHEMTRAETEAKLNELVTRSSSNNRNIGKLLNNKDTSYILNAMAAIAAE